MSHTERERVVRELNNTYFDSHMTPQMKTRATALLLQAFDAGLAAGKRAGAEEERAAVVKWLRADDGAKAIPGSGMATLYTAAYAIGRGTHRESPDAE
jgi:hypothetical protein